MNLSQRGVGLGQPGLGELGRAWGRGHQLDCKPTRWGMAGAACKPLLLQEQADNTLGKAKARTECAGVDEGRPEGGHTLEMGKAESRIANAAKVMWWETRLQVMRSSQKAVSTIN